MQFRFWLIFILFFVHGLFSLHAEETQAAEASDPIAYDALGYTDALILGVVEGLTEYLPVSSTGHLILVDEAISDGEAGQEARNAYLIVIQGGAILAVIFIYWRKILAILMGLLGRNKAGLNLGLKVLVGFLPAAMLGPLLDDFIESKLFNPLAVTVALALGAILMIFVEKTRKPVKIEDAEGLENDEIVKLPYSKTLIIGCLQCVAMWPGMSRSMMTIVGGYFVGLSAKAAAEYSFLLGLVTLTAASAYSLLKSWDVISTQIKLGPAVLGIVIATVVAFLAVKWFVSFLTKYGLIPFAIYRLILSAVIIWVLVV